MTPTTDEVIRRLAARATPVQPLAAPWRRAAVWVGVSVAYVAAVCLVLWGESPAPLADGRFVIEQVAALLTGITAAIAAFATTVPGVVDAVETGESFRRRCRWRCRRR